MMVVALSPLAKIFQPYFHVYDPQKGFKTPVETITQDQLMKHPERMLVEEHFSIQVKRETGAVNLIFNQPRNIPEEMLRTWLTGGPTGTRCQETECYGIVEMPLDSDASAAMTWFATQGKTPDATLLKTIQEARASAQALSTDRVMAAIRRVNTCMRRQYEINEENKLGDFIPSPVEYLCAYALAEEQTKSSAELSAVKSRFKELMSLTSAR